MATTLKNRASMGTATTGTGTVTLGSASVGYQTFADAGVSDADSVRYLIEEGANWEVGLGTYTASGTTLTRTPSESSNGGSAITLGGAAVVSIIATADDIQNHTGADVTLASIGGAAYTTVQQMQDVYHSTGLVSGGGITDAGSGQIDVAAGEGYIRATDDRLDTLEACAWSASLATALTDNALNYVYVFYNAGTPAVTVSISEQSTNDYLKLGSVYRSGTTLHITESSAYFVGDHAVQMISRLQGTAAFAHESGGVVSETGTRNIAITAGTFWEGLNQITTAAVDTSAAGTFSYYYRDGVGGWTEVASSTAIDNTQYDDGSGTLATLSNNKYGVHWVYLDYEGNVYVVYGTGDYTLTDAQNAATLSSVPAFFTDHARLIGKITILKSAASFTEAVSTFSTTFATTTAAAHNELSGLQGGTTAEYYHLTSAEYTSLQAGYIANVVEDTTPQLGGALDGQGNDLNNLGVIFMTEQAAAEADVAGKGQIWVKTATPNELWFTNDAGTDTQLGVASGGGGTAILETIDFSADASWDCTALDNANYDAYEIWLMNVVPATDAADLYMRTSTDGGSTYDSSGYAWAIGSREFGLTTNAVEESDNSDANIKLSVSDHGIGSAAGEDGWSGVVRIYGPHLAKMTRVSFEGVYEGAGGSHWQADGGGVRLSAADVDAIQFRFSSGNIESGSAVLVGIKNA